MKAMWLSIVSAVMLLAGLGTSADALMVTFFDRATFLSATGAASATGALPDLGTIPGSGSASQTVGTVTFSIAPPAVSLIIGTAGISGVANNDWTLRLPGPDIAISDLENLNAALSSSVFSFGFDFVEPETDPNVFAAVIHDSTFTVTLKNGAADLGSFSFNAPNDTAAFIGVWTDSPFNRVEIRETSGGIDNEFFGQVYTGTTPVPLPPTILALGPALVGLAGLRRKVKK